VAPSPEDRLTIEQLERRREDSSSALWLAPVLTMAAQAFLLQILSRESLGQAARASVLAAGLLSTVAALWSLLRARSREVLYSEAIADYLEQAGLPDVRPGALRRHLKKKEERSFRRIDRYLVAWADGDHLPMAYFFWAVALAAFIVADVVVYIAT
jgi:hypothetical protein